MPAAIPAVAAAAAAVTPSCLTVGRRSECAEVRTVSADEIGDCAPDRAIVRADSAADRASKGCLALKSDRWEVRLDRGVVKRGFKNYLGGSGAGERSVDTQEAADWRLCTDWGEPGPLLRQVRGCDAGQGDLLRGATISRLGVLGYR